LRVFFAGSMKPGRLRSLTRLVNKYNIFILEVLKAWIDPAQKNPKTIHHRGYGKFAVDGEIIKLKSKKP
jgi:flavin reductase (DIM6/NTAB) family NADH-FMN oxidoreductase RutF